MEGALVGGTTGFKEGALVGLLEGTALGDVGNTEGEVGGWELRVGDKEGDEVVEEGALEGELLGRDG